MEKSISQSITVLRDLRDNKAGSILRIFKILVTLWPSQVLYILEGQVDGFISNPVNLSYFAFSQPNRMWLETRRSAALFGEFALRSFLGKHL